MVKVIWKFFYSILVILFSSIIVQASEIKDANYYFNELNQQGCKVISHLEKQDNYREILKLEKEDNGGTLVLAVNIVQKCLENSFKDNKSIYNWDIFINDKEIMLLKNKISYKRSNGTSYLQTVPLAYFFGKYHPTWNSENEEILSLTNDETGTNVWDEIWAKQQNQKSKEGRLIQKAGMQSKEVEEVSGLDNANKENESVGIAKEDAVKTTRKQKNMYYLFFMGFLALATFILIYYSRKEKKSNNKQ